MSNTKSVPLCHEIDDISENLIVSPEIIQSTLKTCKVYYKANKSYFEVQLPEMTCPYGISDGILDPKTKKPLNENKATINLSLNNLERKSISACKKMFEDLAEKVIEEATPNSGKWFNMPKLNKEVVRAFFRSNIKYAKKKDENGNPTGEINEEYPPTLAFTLYKNDGLLNVDAEDGMGNKIDINGLNLKGALVTPIVQLTGIWIGASMFGLTWKVLKLRVIPKSQNPSAYVFRDDMEGVLGGSELQEIDEPMSMVKELPQQTTMMNDSEDED